MESSFSTALSALPPWQLARTCMVAFLALGLLTNVFSLYVVRHYPAQARFLSSPFNCWLDLLARVYVCISWRDVLLPPPSKRRSQYHVRGVCTRTIFCCCFFSLRKFTPWDSSGPSRLCLLPA